MRPRSIFEGVVFLASTWYRPAVRPCVGTLKTGEATGADGGWPVGKDDIPVQ